MDSLRKLCNEKDGGRVMFKTGPDWVYGRVTAKYTSHWTVRGGLIEIPIVPCAVAQIWPNPHGPGAEYCFSPEIKAAFFLAGFVQRGYSFNELLPPGSEPPRFTNTGVKVAFVQVKDENIDSLGCQYVDISSGNFSRLWKVFDPHPRLGKMGSYGMLRGSEFLGRTADNEGVSGYLATRSIKFIVTNCYKHRSIIAGIEQ